MEHPPRVCGGERSGRAFEQTQRLLEMKAMSRVPSVREAARQHTRGDRNPANPALSKQTAL